LNTFNGTFADESTNGIGRNVAKASMESVNVNLFNRSGASCMMGVLNLIQAIGTGRDVANSHARLVLDFAEILLEGS
jgi:hypothetical protein